MDIDAKRQELNELRRRVQQLEAELAKAEDASSREWPPKGFYASYYAMVGGVMGSIGAIVSLLANIIGATAVGKSPLELIRVYLTFPLGARALEFDSQNGSVALAMGACLYIGTGMLIGIPIYLAMSYLCGKDSALPKRLVVGAVLGLATWAVAFYGILSWLQPMLFGGNWVTDSAILPVWVAAGTHV
ncbi:MAG: hypothetical protein KDA69_09085, partial [Planctomycetaceae bacterium]|nr:hypothetical protein [Planctomycetaceae bacterium]